MSAPVPGDWFEEERELHSWRRELDRLKRRARARLALTLIAAVLVTAAAVFVISRKVPPVESRVLIRVSESSLLRQDSPLVDGDLAEYIHDAAFTNRNLEELIDRHDLYPLARARGDQFAIDTLRSDLDVEVYKNYFMEKRGYNQPLRTARIAVRYRHRDPDTSFAIAKDLAELIIASESQRRERVSEDVAGLAAAALARAGELLDERQAELASAQVLLEKARADRDQVAIARLKVEVDRLAESVKRQQEAVRHARQSKRVADLQHAMDSRGVGLFFQIVDERPPPPPPDPRARAIRLAMVSLACFLLVLPLCAIGIGAFDQRLHDREDVQRLGLGVVGHVPPFAGSTVGSLRARRRAAGRPGPRAAP
ncbi:MAG TPA: hypothetical protein VKZ63_16225 [Kofleriaceae bacterium]|nr:hypothetical protein [Kofleriaceae bacterium]